MVSEVSVSRGVSQMGLKVGDTRKSLLSLFNCMCLPSLFSPALLFPLKKIVYYALLPHLTIPFLSAQNDIDMVRTHM